MEETDLLEPQVDGIISKYGSDRLIAKMWKELNWMKLKRFYNFAGMKTNFKFQRAANILTTFNTNNGAEEE